MYPEIWYINKLLPHQLTLIHPTAYIVILDYLENLLNDTRHFLIVHYPLKNGKNIMKTQKFTLGNLLCS